MSTRPSVMGRVRSSPPNDRHVAESCIVLHGCPLSLDAWGRLNVVTPFHHLSEDSHTICPLGARPITASRLPPNLPKPTKRDAERAQKQLARGFAWARRRRRVIAQSTANSRIRPPAARGSFVIRLVRY
jgi:hypothetical protein